jgi:hypothetical protein
MLGYLAIPWPLRLALAAFLLWPLEIHGWADAPRWLLLNGASTGLWGGLFLAIYLPTSGENYTIVI